MLPPQRPPLDQATALNVYAYTGNDPLNHADSSALLGRMDILRLVERLSKVTVEPERVLAFESGDGLTFVLSGDGAGTGNRGPG